MENYMKFDFQEQQGLECQLGVEGCCI